MARGGSSRRYLLGVGGILIILVVGAGSVYPKLIQLYQTHPVWNGLILLLLLVGLGEVLIQLKSLVQEDRSIDQVEGHLLALDQEGETPEQINEAILAIDSTTLQEFLGNLHKVVSQGQHEVALPYLLDSLAKRGTNRRNLAHALARLLATLGVLGILWGLLQSVTAVQGILANLAGEENPTVAALLAQLQEASGGTGLTGAFAIGLFGLGGSALLRFTEAQLGHALTLHRQRVEELVTTGLLPFWRSQARPAGLESGVEERPAYTAALLEGVSERLDEVTDRIDQLLTRQSQSLESARSVNRLGQDLHTELHELKGRLDRLEGQQLQALYRVLNRVAKVLAQTQGRE